MGKPTVGIFGLTGCAGDQLAILNCEDQLLDLVAFIDIRDFLMGSSGNDTGCALDVALEQIRELIRQKWARWIRESDVEYAPRNPASGQRSIASFP